MIDPFKHFPKGGSIKKVDPEFAGDPKDALYTMRSSVFSGFLSATFRNGNSMGGYFYRGRPLLLIYYSSDGSFEIGKSAIEKASKSHDLGGAIYTSSDIEQDIMHCFAALLSQYPIIRNFSPQMLVVDELFNRMAFEALTGCMYITTPKDQVLLFICNGEILDWEDGKVLNRYLINEAPVIRDLAKAVTLMSDSNSSINIFEVPENLYSDLTILEYGIPFRTPKSLNVLKESLTRIVAEELKGKSIDFDRALQEIGNNQDAIEEVCNNLDKHMTMELSRRVLLALTEKLTKEIAEFKGK